MHIRTDLWLASNAMENQPTFGIANCIELRRIRSERRRFVFSSSVSSWIMLPGSNQHCVERRFFSPELKIKTDKACAKNH